MLYCVRKEKTGRNNETDKGKRGGKKRGDTVV
jgi:hypothetical protein